MEAEERLWWSAPAEGALARVRGRGGLLCFRGVLAIVNRIDYVTNIAMLI